MSDTLSAGLEAKSNNAAKNERHPDWEWWAILYLRLALGASFLSGIADRFGLYRGRNVGYGNFAGFMALHGQSEFFHARFHDSVPCVGGYCRGIFTRSRSGSWHLASLGGSWQFSAAYFVRHCHGYLFRDQVSAGLFDILRVRRSALARVIPHPHAEGDIVNPFC